MHTSYTIGVHFPSIGIPLIWNKTDFTILNTPPSRRANRAMALPPHVGRTLYRTLLRACDSLERELARCGALRVREVEALRRAAGTALPKDLRGLLDVRGRRANVSGVRSWVGIVTRRVVDAALSPRLVGVDGAAGFAALRHVNGRLDALRRLVYATTSRASTHGVRVMTRSSYAGFERARFQFRYAIRIENASQTPIQLLSRAWTISDLDGRVSEVAGPGVVGAFPLIAPNQTYEYESACPLQTPIGTQRGHFIFHVGGNEIVRPLSDVLLAPDDGGGATTTGGRMLQVEVAPFSYRTPSLDEHLGEAAAEPQTKAAHRASRKRGRRRSDESGRRR